VNSRNLKAIIRTGFGWGNATVSLQTKKINGLHENDFIMATKIDRIFARTAAG
jgi:4a-hydroxytetrahydrobiopterin dehydratase